MNFIKRIAIISSALVLTVIFYTSTHSKDISLIPVMTLPVSNRVIVLDAGHGIPDERSPKCKWSYRSYDKFKYYIKIAEIT